MRIARIDLLRYGKFTDQSVTLPQAEHDFHFILGPNEAGKSTLRDAIQDLLFGIETRSRYNFLHPHSEMRLGARLERKGGTLDFVRIKARSNTLKTPDGANLPDLALGPFLGPIDRAFFDQMFGLNHQRLVAGGEQILNASNDIGRILFQAAAGIGSLGEIRERLEQEADTLWGKRRSGDREYYQASDEFEQAKADLEHTTVRAKDWLEARKRVEEIHADLEQARTRRGLLERERSQLERVRRIAPTLSALVEQERQLAELGEVIVLPEDADRQLHQAEQEIALAKHSLLLFEKQTAELQTRRDALHPDPAILARAADIEALTALRQQLKNHERDIGRREEEVRLLTQALQQAARQLDWPEDNETALFQRLPGRLVRSALDDLLRRQGTLAQSLLHAEEEIRSSEHGRVLIDSELAELPATELPVGLPDAMAAARALGDVAIQQKRLETQINRLTRELEMGMVELGAWQADPEVLRKRVLPSRDETAGRVQRRAELESSVTKLTERVAETRADIEALQLEITQYRAARRPVTQADVQQQRAERDATWQAIKSGTLALQHAAADYERQVAAADMLSDQRHDKAQEETELQSKLDRLQRQQHQLAGLESRSRQEQAALREWDAAWDRQMVAVGLAGMPLLRIESWRASRDRVLQTANAVHEAVNARTDFQREAAEAKADLAEVLQTIESDTAGLELPALLRRAEQAVEMAAAASARRKTLAAQKDRTENALAEAGHRRDEARKAMENWRSELHRSLSLAHLPADATLGALRGVLALFEDMQKHVEKIQDLRVNRIGMMRRDLEDFAAAARTLAHSVAPAIAQLPAEQISLHLESRLKLASADAQERERLDDELQVAEAKAREAGDRITAAQAGLQPLLQRVPHACGHEDLREAIQRSDRYRQRSGLRDQALSQILCDGDGLDRAALEAEVSGTDAQGIPVRLVEIGNEIDELVGKQNRCSADLQAAQTALSQIAGQDEAARAESRRQEALARMSNAVERYLRVHTAAKLLRWSIERFRESKQGPMLSRASEIFERLTGGSMQRLCVDHEKNPPALFALRPGGSTVGIDGMSEGTRDQLYFALRLAALELHLEQTEPLPFIADDLFINYDDGRARAGFEALATLSGLTQVLFLSHHRHLLPVAQSVFGGGMNVVGLQD